MRTTAPSLLLLVVAARMAFGIEAGLDPKLLRTPNRRSAALVVRKEPDRPGGLAFSRAFTTPAQARKLAYDPRVAAVLSNSPIPVPPVPGPHITWADVTQRRPTVPAGRGPLQPTMWLAKDIHGAPAAWTSGYTGTGVKIAILDEGIDFGHPDLEGCQARVEDPSSAYFGWPIAFDPSAMAYYASTGRATGGYADTRTSVTDGAAVFRGRTYTLPGTSKSGVYHIGAHPSYWLPFLIGKWGEQPAVLVADEVEPGVYDTVYVDLNKNRDFRDDKPCRRGDETATFDLDGDGLADFSAGMVYFIADGKRPIPASDWVYHLPPPANGSLVAFAGSFGKDEAHGTLVASAIAARGNVGKTYELPQKQPGSGGMVYGIAPGARIIQVGSIYGSHADLFDALQFSVLGYDGVPGTGDDADIVNMSFSVPSETAGGWDFLSRYITSLSETVAPRTTFVASIGNGGPGYGTVTSPGGSNDVVTVGAATLYGSTDAFGPIASPEQILFGDVQQWSDRGPSRLGQVKPDVVAIGAWATGDVPVYGSGEYAWGTWGGTSLSAPITSGILALIYQAYRSRTGTFPDHEEARAILMAGAKDLSYNVFEQGAGMADAARSTEIASGAAGFVVKPSSWAAGGRLMGEAPGFVHALRPGEAAVTDFAIENTGTTPLRLSFQGRRLLRVGGATLDVRTGNDAEDLEAAIDRPDYLVHLRSYIPRDADLLRIRISLPYSKFSLADPASRMLKPSSLWLASLLDWTDLDGSGSLWLDTNGNGAVNDGEFQSEEANRFMIASAWSDVIELSAKHPAERLHDGLFLGLHHALKNPSIPTTSLKVELELYRQVEWTWLGIPARPVVLAPKQTMRVPIKLQPPHDTAPGVYGGALAARDQDGREVNVPISTVVLAEASAASQKEPVLDGSDGIGDTYDNGRMFGAFDWSWAEESGDWRFYFMDVTARKPEVKSFVLANAQWPDMPSDTDILIYRPNRSDYFSDVIPGVFGPYGLTRSGSSRLTHSSAGMWPFDTATGGPSEWVAGEAAPGLNLIQLHNVLDSGLSGGQPFDLRAGLVWLDPSELNLAPGQTTASVEISSTMSLGRLSALAFGFATPSLFPNQPIRQDAITTPSSSRWVKDVLVSGGGMLDVATSSTDPIDLDLYLLYDANGDGHFDWDYEVLAMSATPAANEHIRYYLPRDGVYRVAVHGYSVPRPSTFDASVLVVSGTDIRPSLPAGPVQRGRPKTVSLSFAAAPAGSTGIVFLGPPEAPGVIPLPISVGAR